MQYAITSEKTTDCLIALPLSKSMANRAAILFACSQQALPLYLREVCDDTRVMLDALLSKEEVKDIEAAGTAMRFLTAYYAQKEGTVLLTGSKRMKERPIRILVDALRQCGAQIEYVEKEGFPPLRITGTRLDGGHIALDGSISSQYISALLLIAPQMKNGLQLELLHKVTSWPYIEMTLSLLKQQGISFEMKENHIEITPQAYQPNKIKIEADWSAASYWYEMVAISQTLEVNLPGLQRNSLQGDAVLATYFEKLGVETLFTPQGVRLRPTHTVCESLQIDLRNSPDIAQTIAVCCALRNIPFKLTGLHTLRIKETDRLLALQSELAKLGYVVTIENDDTLSWDGQKTAAAPHPLICTYDDHRMAMAFAPAALKVGRIRIDNPLVVNKSYPNYYEDLKKAGFEVDTLAE